MKKTLLISFTTIAVGFASAQKSSDQPLLVKYDVIPARPLDASIVRYTSEIVTPLDPLTSDEEDQATLGMGVMQKEKAIADAKARKLESYGKGYLNIKLNRLIPVRVDGDFKIKLETSEADVSNLALDKLSEMGDDDIVFRYSYTAKLTVTGKSGETLLEEYVHKAEADQKVTKLELWDNPALKAKLALVKNNPEKQRDIVQKFINKREYQVLEEALRNAHRTLNLAFAGQIRQVPHGLFGVKGKDFSEIATVNETIMTTWRGTEALSQKKRLPKADLDAALLAAVPVWEKYINEKPGGIEDAAVRGLQVNCALAYIYNGDLPKAKEYLDMVPEAVKSPAGEEIVYADAQGGGQWMTFDLAGYARNTRDTYEIFTAMPERIKFYQE